MPNSTILNEPIKDKIRSAYKRLADNTPGFRPRASQRKMVGAIASHLGQTYEEDERPDEFMTPIMVVEAGTGTGKTYGYALPLIILAQACGKKLILSTGTVALQEQIVNKDLPDLSQRSGILFSYVLAKGRRRYVCPSRLAQIAGDNQQTSLLLEAGASSNDHQTSVLWYTMSEAFENKAWDGDRDAWPTPIKDDAWMPISTDRHGCMGAQCSFMSMCPFYEARAKMADADVVVANHDLLLSDLGLGGGVILPHPEKSLLAIDEGHHLPDKALEYGSSSHWLLGSRDWLSKTYKSINSGVLALPAEERLGLGANFARECEALISEIHVGLTRLSGSLFTSGKFKIDEHDAEDTWRFEHGAIPGDFRLMGEEIKKPSSSLLEKLRKLSDKVRESARNGAMDESTAEGILPDLGFLVSRMENMVETWKLMLRDDVKGKPPLARWVMAKNKGVALGVDYMIAVSPIDAGDMLNEMIWNRFAGVIVTSATLTALRKFDLYLRRTGLTHHQGLETLALQSPFDFQKQSVLAVPDLGVDPKDSEKHTSAIIEWVQDGIDSSMGTLMLFSSYRQLRAVREALPESLKSIVRVQGETPKSLLIHEHKEAIDRGEGSLIMGVDSMGEGIDLPGKYCSHVVIAKLPFTVPTTPVEAAISEWVEAQGGMPFFEITVPATSTKLIQRVGRLLRSEDDTGRVTILDNRLIHKGYGHDMLNALPPMRREVG